ncbi:MAG: hypothetical protein EA391_07870 [Balneolaceae bacterium]|nr:MAG: hypothetical protein EA391_07870 [Balneolaceae bacterium]
MKLIEKRDKPEFYKTLETFDTDTQTKYPTTFWFYSDDEQNLKTAANELQKYGYSIEHCGSSATEDFLLIALMDISTGFDNYEQLWNEFDMLANEYRIIFDGWETRIDLE